MNTTGALFINYMGHAVPHNWAAEQILVYHTDDFANSNDKYYSDFDAMNNATQLPVVLSMNCLDGYWIDPRSAWQPSLSVTLQNDPITTPLVRILVKTRRSLFLHSYMNSDRQQITRDTCRWPINKR
jgi:hypothetical protein